MRIPGKRNLTALGPLSRTHLLTATGTFVTHIGLYQTLMIKTHIKYATSTIYSNFSLYTEILQPETSYLAEIWLPWFLILACHVTSMKVGHMRTPKGYVCQYVTDSYNFFTTVPV